MNEGRHDSHLYFIPLAIIIAGALIGGGLAYGLNGLNSGTLSAGPQPQIPNEPLPPANIELRAVAAEDHIRGDVNAPITIVEYSDLECPFCKRFHPTMQQVMEGYKGKVRWVYRHFPLTELHSKALKEAEATECAAEQGKFWEYTDRLFEITPSNDGLDLALLPQIAKDVSIDVEKFNACLSSGKYVNHIQDDAADAVKAGGQGTPYSVIISPKGNKTPIPGAYPFERVAAIIDEALKEL